MRMRRTLLLLLSMALGAGSAPAQQRPRSDSLPRELVTALLGGSMGGPAIDVQAGLADSALPAGLFRDALLLGYGDFRGTVMTVAYFPYAPQETIDTIRARLVASGYRRPAQDTTRGFVNSWGSSFTQAVCSDRSVVVPTVRIRSLNRTLAVISRQVSAPMVQQLCSDSAGPRRREFYNPAADTPLPSLEPPPGMESRGGGSSGAPDGDRAMEMSSSLLGDLPLADIVAHYTRIFTNARWRKTEELQSASIAILVFETTTPRGERWHCAFTINIPTRGSAQVSLALRRLL